MRNIVVINKKQMSNDLFHYEVTGYEFESIHDSTENIMNFKWKLMVNGKGNLTRYQNHMIIENAIIAILKEDSQYSNSIFTFKDSVKSDTCQCGKEIHNFFAHMFFCPKYINKK